MINCASLSFEHLLPLVKSDKYWGKYIAKQLSRASESVALHLAIFNEPYLQYILDGRKTVESRFSINRNIPYEAISAGDVILLKKASGPIMGICQVSYAWFYRLNQSSWRMIKREFTSSICAQDPEFWTNRKKASYATLLRIDHVKQISPLACNKMDRRGWVVLQKMRSQQEVKLS